MTRPLIILGASGNALDILDVVDAINAQSPTWQIVGLLDDARQSGSLFEGVAVLGPLSNARKFDEAWFICAIGSDRSFRQRPRIVSETGLSPTSFATLVHPLATVSPRAALGRGVCVNAGVSIAGNVVVGDGAWLGAGSIVGHDSVIGEHAILAPASVVSGRCQIGGNCYIGAAAAVRQKVRIGAGALIGMGAMVLRDVEPGAMVVGNPARLLERLVPASA